MTGDLRCSALRGSQIPGALLFREASFVPKRGVGHVIRAGASRRLAQQPKDGPASDGAPSVLGYDLTVRGRLDATGEVEVHGVVAGHISAPKVTLWPDGYVEGSILAQEAHIHGHLNGKAVARTVVVGPSAIIEGQIFHHKIDMAGGNHTNARFPWRPVNYFEQLDQQLQLLR